MMPASSSRMPPWATSTPACLQVHRTRNIPPMNRLANSKAQVMPMPGSGRETREFSPPSGISTYGAPKKDSMAASGPMEEDSRT